MRRLLILAPLGMLLLASCEPGSGDSGGATGRQGKPTSTLDATMPANKRSYTQTSAQESVGSTPLPRNLVSATGDICPVHHEKMKMREIPIVFEDSADSASPAGDPSAAAAYPFGAEKIVSSGNALLPAEPHSARVYRCASCIAARHAAEEKQAPANPRTPTP